MKIVLLSVALCLAFAGLAQAQAWFELNSAGTASSSSKDSVAPGKSARATLSGATSLVLDTGNCRDVTIVAANLTGTDINPVYCATQGCSTPAEVSATPLSDGDYWILDYPVPAIQITGGTSGDIVEVVCGG